MRTHLRRIASLMLLVVAAWCLCRGAGADEPASRPMNFDVRQIDRARVMKHADAWLKDEPVTVTAEHSPRSAGGAHDFFSEGDYWWPDPKDPNAPYVQRDGMTNPDNFVAHRHAMIRFSRHV